MKCPECGDLMRKIWKSDDFIWLCRSCGSATWGADCEVYVPTQAKQFAAMRALLARWLRWQTTLQDLVPDDLYDESVAALDGKEQS